MPEAMLFQLQCNVLEYPDDEMSHSIPFAVCTSVTEAKAIAEQFHGGVLEWEADDDDPELCWHIADGKADVIGDGFEPPPTVHKWIVRPYRLNKSLTGWYRIVPESEGG